MKSKASVVQDGMLISCNYQWLWEWRDSLHARRTAEGELGDFSKPVALM